MKRIISIISALLIAGTATAGTYQAATIRNQVEYPTRVINAFVKACSTTMANELSLEYGIEFATEISEKSCSCIMDEFRADFTLEEFTNGGVKLAQLMSGQYAAYCKSILSTTSLDL